MAADEVGKLLQVTRGMVHRLTNRGELLGRKLGRIGWFSREAIEVFMRGGMAEHPVRYADACERDCESNG